jgi:hypothetical protein
MVTAGFTAEAAVSRDDTLAHCKGGIMTDDVRLKDGQFYTGDPVLVFLRNKLHLEDGWIIAGSVLLAGLALLAVPTLLGLPIDLNTLVVDLLEMLVVIPLGLLLYLSLPNLFDDLFNTLTDNGVVGPRRADVTGPASYAAFLQNLVLQANRRIWVVGALILPAAYWIYRLSGYVAGDTTSVGTPQTQLLLRLAVLVAYTLSLYGVVFSIVRMLILLVFSVRLFRTFHVQVNPLHPDGSGGFAIVGRLLTASVLLATIIGAAAVAMSLLFLARGSNPLWRIETLLLGTIYLLLTPLLLYGWLWTPHQAMLEARDQVLRPLADEFQQAIQRSMPTAQDDAAGVKAGTERLDEIKQRYELLHEAFPTFPVRTFVSSSLIVTSVLPALSALLSSLVPSVQEALLRLFKVG